MSVLRKKYFCLFSTDKFEKHQLSRKKLHFHGVLGMFFVSYPFLLLLVFGLVLGTIITLCSTPRDSRSIMMCEGQPGILPELGHEGCPEPAMLRHGLPCLSQHSPTLGPAMPCYALPCSTMLCHALLFPVCAAQPQDQPWPVSYSVSK